MQHFIYIIAQFKEYFIVTFLIIISIILLASNDTKQIKAIRGYTVGFIGFVQDALAIVPNVFELEKENKHLRKLNVTLSDEVSRLREAKIENENLRKMLQFKENYKYKLITADVIGKSLYLLRNTITINCGDIGK